jgi:hypothetical protein
MSGIVTPDDRASVRLAATTQMEGMLSELKLEGETVASLFEGSKGERWVVPPVTLLNDEIVWGVEFLLAVSQTGISAPALVRRCTNQDQVDWLRYRIDLMASAVGAPVRW